MQRSKFFYYIFTSFFILTVPFLVFLSFGYNINLEKIEFQSELSVDIQTYPIGASVAIGDQKLITPTELRLNQNGNYNISVGKEGFKNESFNLFKKENETNYINLKNLWLLPSNPLEVLAPDNYYATNSQLKLSQSTKSTQNSQSESTQSSSLSSSITSKIEQLNFLDNGQSIVKFDNDYYVQKFNFKSMVGEPIVISDKLFSAKNLNTKLLEPSNIPKLEQAIKNNFDKLDENSYYSNNLILTKKSNQYFLINLDNYNLNAKFVAKKSSSEYIILDNNSSLWLYDINTDKTSFVDKGFDEASLAVATNSIFLTKKDKIFKIPATQISKETQIDLFLFRENKQFLKSIDSSNDIKNELITESIFQGYIIQNNGKLWFMDDTNPNDKKNSELIAKNVLKTTTQKDSAFWIDSNGDLMEHNFFYKNERKLASGIDLTFQNLSTNKISQTIQGSSQISNSSNSQDSQNSNQQNLNLQNETTQEPANTETKAESSASNSSIDNIQILELKPKNIIQKKVDFELFYSKDWRRIMIYNPSKTISVWSDNENINPNLIATAPIVWTEGQSCQKLIENGTQFCIKEGKLHVYKNNFLIN